MHVVFQTGASNANAPPTQHPQTHLEVLYADVGSLEHLAVPQLRKVAPGTILHQEENALINLRGTRKAGAGRA